MHTVWVILTGLALLIVCVLLGHILDRAMGSAVAALAFLPLWFVAAGINMFIGVKKAGYPVAQEIPLFLEITRRNCPNDLAFHQVEVDGADRPR